MNRYLSLGRMGLLFAAITLAILPSATLPAQDIPQSASLEVIHGKPFVKVMVNGQGPFRFVVDTGTGGQAFVTPALADRLGLPSAGQVRLSDPSGQGKQRVPMVMIQSLRVAGVEFSGIRAVKHTLTDEDGTCMGLLGFTLFRNYLLTLDYPRKRMMLTSGALIPDGERTVLPFRMPDGIPIIPLHIGDLQIDAEIDSGGGGLSLPEGIVSRLKFSSIPSLFSNAQSLSSRFQVKAATLATNVSLGGYTFTRPFVEINPAFPLANFGSYPMQKFAFTFDQKNTLVLFKANQPTLHLSVTPIQVRWQNTPEDRLPTPNLIPVG